MGLKDAPMKATYEGIEVRVESHSAMVGGFFRLYVNDECVDEGPCTLTETAVLRATWPGDGPSRQVIAKVTMAWRKTTYALEIGGVSVEMSDAS